MIMRKKRGLFGKISQEKKRHLIWMWNGMPTGKNDAKINDDHQVFLHLLC